MSNELATKEGIFVGITSGATFAGALKVAAEAPKGSNILAMLPDTGERYLSTPLFANVPAEMTPEELEISLSTPGAQFPKAECRARPSPPLRGSRAAGPRNSAGLRSGARARTTSAHVGFEHAARQRAALA